jgi:VWFA-related protein
MLISRLLAVSILALASMCAQETQFTPVPEPDPYPQEPTIKVDVDVVNILASVRNKKGGLVSNLTKDDFSLEEDGKPQTIKYFARDTELPLTIGLLVDVSRSQERLIDLEKDAASQFFDKVLRKNDLAFLISFGSEVELLQDYTGSPRLLSQGLDGLRVNGPVGGVMPGPVPTIYKPRGTVLYDAVYLAADEKLKGQVGRKVIVLITDGVDQGSRLKIHDALLAAQQSDAIVYSIYYSDPRAYSDYDFGPTDSALKRMSEETGGRVFKVDRKHPLSDAFRQIEEEMRSQYAIGYTPTNPQKDGTFRRIEIKTSMKDAKVQARRGYYSSKPPA